MLRLAARTRLEGDHQAWPGEPAVLEMLTRRIKFSQKRGLIREDISPEHLSIMLMGIIYFWLERREYLAYRFGARINDADYLRQAIALIERGIEPLNKRKTAAKSREKSK
jgi:hypothetical protein